MVYHEQYPPSQLLYSEIWFKYSLIFKIRIFQTLALCPSCESINFSSASHTIVFNNGLGHIGEDRVTVEGPSNCSSQQTASYFVKESYSAYSPGLSPQNSASCFHRAVYSVVIITLVNASHTTAQNIST